MCNENQQKTFKSDDEGDPEAEVVGETNAVVKTLRETVRTRLVLKINLNMSFFTLRWAKSVLGNFVLTS